MITTALIALIHQASVTRASPRRCRARARRAEPSGDEHDAGPQVAADAGAQRRRRAVRAHGHLVAVAHAEPVRVVAREVDQAVGPLEAELLDALDGGAGEERPVADEPEPVGRVGRWRAGAGARAPDARGAPRVSPSSSKGVPNSSSCTSDA